MTDKKPTAIKNTSKRKPVKNSSSLRKILQLPGILKKKIPVWSLLIAILLGTCTLVSYHFWRIASMPSTRNVVTRSMLEKIVHVSDLSTYEAVYNGVAQIMNPTKPETVDYYVSYASKIRAGIDFSEVKIKVDNRTKTIEVSIPSITIDEADVDITSMDFIFQNPRSNTSTVTQEAYKACIADASQESLQEGAIYSLAEQNAENIIKALIQPFVQQMDSGYSLHITQEDEE